MVGGLVPQFCLFHLITLLQKRQAGASVSSEAWLWVLALAVSTVITSSIESQVFWLSQSELAIPVRAQLSSLIFQKAMRRKDVKGAKKSKKAAEEVKNDDGRKSPAEPVTDGKPPGAEESEAKNNEEALTKQSTINLISVDAQRVSQFCNSNNYFPGSFFQLLFSFTFLLYLIGWQSLLAGIIFMALVMPINILFSKRYAAAQGRLMKVRDEKVSNPLSTYIILIVFTSSALSRRHYRDCGN